MEEDQMPDFVIVTGMSGAGRTEAMHVFEDLGYYCVDNLPSSLLADLVRVNESTEHEGGRRRLAVVCDSRNGDFFGDLEAELSSMQEAGVSYKTLFLDAADDKLIARYKSSRRRHPLCTDGTTIWQGIQRERLMLMGLRDRADYVIDTTDMLPQKLRSTIRGSSPRAASARDSRSPCTPSASSTALPTTPTSSWTCASCRTPITIRSCGR